MNKVYSALSNPEDIEDRTLRYVRTYLYFSTKSVRVFCRGECYYK